MCSLKMPSDSEIVSNEGSIDVVQNKGIRVNDNGTSSVHNMNQTSNQTNLSKSIWAYFVCLQQHRQLEWLMQGSR